MLEIPTNVKKEKKEKRKKKAAHLFFSLQIY